MFSNEMNMFILCAFLSYSRQWPSKF